MRRNLAVLLSLVMLVGFVAPIHAQENENDELWFWATTPAGLVAYTLDGQINVLIDDRARSEALYQGTRLSVETAILYEDDSHTLSLVSSETVATTPLDEIFDVFQPHQYRHPYVLFSGARPFPAAGILNVETTEISPLTGYVNPAMPPLVFVDDTTVRYYSYAEPAPGRETPSTLWERDLVTGEETALLEFAYPSFRVFYSQDGEQWWIAGKSNTETRQFEEVTTFGEVNPAITSLLQDMGTSGAFETLLTIDLSCEVDCPVTATSIGGATFTFTLPTNNGLSPQIPARTSDGSLLILHLVEEETLYRLDPSGNLTELGIIDVTSMPFSFQLASRTRWLVVLGQGEDNDPETRTYRLWDVETGQLITEAPLENFIFTNPADDSVLVFNGSQRMFYTVATVYDLSSYKGRFFQPLANAQVLFETLPSATEMAHGIYVYDAPSDTFNLLVPEGRGIPLQDFSRQN